VIADRDSNVLCSDFGKWTIPYSHAKARCRSSIRASNWPARVRWSNGTQALVDEYGVLPKLYRRDDEVTWQTPAEPIYCDNVQRSLPGGRLPQAATNLSGSPAAAIRRAYGATIEDPADEYARLWRAFAQSIADCEHAAPRVTSAIRCHAGSWAAAERPSTIRARCATASCRRYNPAAAPEASPRLLLARLAARAPIRLVILGGVWLDPMLALLALTEAIASPFISSIISRSTAASGLGTLAWTGGGHCPPQVRPERRFAGWGLWYSLSGTALPGKARSTASTGAAKGPFVKAGRSIRPPGVNRG
jgi:hypothetical protein